MKILLVAINAKYIHSNLAVYCLKAYAEKNMPQDVNVQIELAEYTINQNRDEILKDIYRRQAEMVCFSCYIWNLDYVESMIRDVKKVMEDVIIWAGGPEVSYDSRETLGRLPELTGVMKGEGEKTFAKLCEVYGKRSETSELLLEQIDGITFRCPDGTICERPWREPMDLSEVPFVYHDMKKFENKIIYYETSRGCPFSCSYCLSSIDKRLRFRSRDLVFNELQFFLDHKVPQVKFVDRTFNCKHDHAMAIWKYIQEHDNGITNFHFEVAADLLNDEEIRLIRQMRPGLIQLEIGVQSTNTDTIREIRRTMRLEEVREHVARIKEKGNIHQHLDLIAGLPYEDYDSFGRSFDEIYELKPNQLQLGFLKVLKGSYMFEHAAEYGIVYHDRPPYEVMSTKWLSFDDVIKIKRVEEMLEVYYNSGQFEITMKLMECIFDSAFEFFQELGDFYEANGYFGMSHSRIRRCEILLEFLALYLHGRDSNAMTSVGLSENAGDRDNTDCDEHAIDRENTDFDEKAQIYRMIQESLIFDLYYRENCKSRPWWATDVGSFKHMTHAYCKNGKLSHVEPFHYIFPDKHTRKLDELPKYHKEPVWALFHYDMRDPLDHQAMVEYVE